jgi:uncharacterized protein YeaO (DUF488 family)
VTELYTSRWANRDLAHLDVVPVGISRGVPRWRTPYRYKLLRLLAPSREAFGISEPQEFERAYKAELEKIGLERIVSELWRISEEHGGRPLVMLCWERPGEFCHRRVLADWIEKNVGVEVPELVPGMIQADDPAQERLF